MHLSRCEAKIRFLCTPTSIIDLVSFMPWFIEHLLPYKLPNLQFLRVVRLFRLFKSNSVARHAFERLILPGESGIGPHVSLAGFEHHRLAHFK